MIDRRRPCQQLLRRLPGFPQSSRSLSRLARVAARVRAQATAHTPARASRPTHTWPLVATLPDVPITSAGPANAAEARGAEIFGTTCATCHVPPAFTGTPVALSVLGTDPHLGQSADRGTGTYRVPSLRGVSTRGALLHDASLPNLSSMFDPARSSADYQGGRHGPGPVAGHSFGLALDGADRTAQLAYLATL